MKEQIQKHILEGPPSEKMAGFRHYLIFDPAMPRGDVRRLQSCICRRMAIHHTAAFLQAKLWQAGTWEVVGGQVPGDCFPSPRPEFLAQFPPQPQPEFAL